MSVFSVMVNAARMTEGICGQEITGTVGITIASGLAHLQVDLKHGNIKSAGVDSEIGK